MKQNVICIREIFKTQTTRPKLKHAELEFPGLTTGKFYENEK